jgi:hypothetical protein
MRQRVPLTFAGSSYSPRMTQNNIQDTINWYLELDQVEGKQQTNLLPTSGSVFVKLVGQGPFRGALVFKNNVYFVSYNEVYKMDVLENLTLLGTLNTTGGRVSMATNGVFGDQLLIIDGTDGWVYDESTLTKITDLDFPSNPKQCTFLDSYFIVIDNEGKFWISASNDATNWDALDFATAERDPDNIIAVTTNIRDLHFIGEYTSEIWTNVGALFPFAPYSNGVIEKGTPAAFSVAKADDWIYYLTQDRHGNRQVIKQRGLDYEAISNPALDYELTTYDTVADAHAFIYSEGGHTFYQLTFPSVQKTWIYDISLNNPLFGWQRRRTLSGQHIAGIYVFFNGKHYIGHYANNKLLYLDLNTFTDDGESIVRERVGGISSNQNNTLISYYSVEIECKVGIGLTTGQGSDPQIALSWSDDRGNTWSNSRTTSLGKKGNYNHIVRFHDLGQAKDRLFKVVVSDPVEVIITNMYAWVEQRDQ